MGIMSAPILATKLFRPTVRPQFVPRRHLLKRLNQDAKCRLILVSAPAGFGKTTLVTEWLTQLITSSNVNQAAWLSLDEGDNDPTRFFIT